MESAIVSMVPQYKLIAAIKNGGQMESVIVLTVLLLYPLLVRKNTGTKEKEFGLSDRTYILTLKNLFLVLNS
jgi:hypothetical protein